MERTYNNIIIIKAPEHNFQFTHTLKKNLNKLYIYIYIYIILKCCCMKSTTSDKCQQLTKCKQVMLDGNLLPGTGVNIRQSSDIIYLS